MYAKHAKTLAKRSGGVEDSFDPVEDLSTSPTLAETESQTSVHVSSSLITPIEEGEYTCEPVKVGFPEDRSSGSWQPRQSASFDYCTISWKVGCSQPPCIDEVWTGRLLTRDSVFFWKPSRIQKEEIKARLV